MIYSSILIWYWVQRYGVASFTRQPVNVHPHGDLWFAHTLATQGRHIGLSTDLTRQQHRALWPIRWLETAMHLVTYVVCVAYEVKFQYSAAHVPRQAWVTILLALAYIFVAAISIAGLRMWARRRMRSLVAGQKLVYLSGLEIIRAHMKFHDITLRFKRNDIIWWVVALAILVRATKKMGQLLELPPDAKAWVCCFVFNLASAGWLFAPLLGWRLFLAQQYQAPAVGTLPMAPTAPRRFYRHMWHLGLIAHIAYAGLLWRLLPWMRTSFGAS